VTKTALKLQKALFSIFSTTLQHFKEQIAKAAMRLPAFCIILDFSNLCQLKHLSDTYPIHLNMRDTMRWKTPRFNFFSAAVNGVF
jgi:hypothetical protein